MCGLEAGGGEGEAGGQEPGGQQVPRPPCNQPRLLLVEGVVDGSETRDSDTQSLVRTVITSGAGTWARCSRP